ncbi:MAG: 1,6-anhydro-N-acetylmuramyl-L-alanine amidase AmpD [Pseudomonadales bacterium]
MPAVREPRADPLRVNSEHWLTRVRRRISPNQDSRPGHSVPELVVVHCISLPPGRYGSGDVERLFGNALDADSHPAYADLRGVRVSAHLFIDRRGRVTQFVAFDRRAWHAGASSWRGRPRCNDFSIGVELEGCDDRAYTAAQYRRLRLVLQALFARYPHLAPDAVVGHQEVAPGRKTDPGPGFDWRRLLLEFGP